MTFDGQTASTLDVIDVGFPAPSRGGRRFPARAPVASTVDGELVPEAPTSPSTSTIDPMLVAPGVLSIESDLGEFRAWLDRTGTAAVLDLVAKAFARHMGITAGLTVVLETEAEDPSAQRAVVLASVAPQAEDALDKLFAFTSSPWWLSVVRATRNAIVVDIQPA